MEYTNIPNTRYDNRNTNKEITSEQIKIQTKLELKNPNGFEIITKNLHVETTIKDGTSIAEMEMPGDNIPGNQNKTFTKEFDINFKGQNPEKLITKISGEVGVKIGFIEKTIPLAANIVTLVEELLNNIEAPVIKIKTEIKEFFVDKIQISADLDIYNPNSFDMEIKDLKVDIKNETGCIVGNVKLDGDILKGKQNMELQGEGTLNIQGLNAETLMFNTSLDTVANIGGFKKSLKIQCEVEVQVPDLKTILPSKLPTKAIVKGDLRLSIFGIIDTITLEVQNPNNIELFAKDITVIISRVDRNNKRVIATGKIEEGIIKANKTTCLNGEAKIPFRKILIPALGERIIPDALEIEVLANITIKGFKNYVWVGVGGYQDLRLFRKDKGGILQKTSDWW